MNNRAKELANLLLIEGSLRRDDPEHRHIYEELMGNALLFEDVRARLEAVSFQLVQEMGYLGARLSRESLEDTALKNGMGLHAGHIRLIVWLWVQLVYREWNDLRRGLHSGAPGQTSLLMSEEDEAPWISYKKVLSDFGEKASKSHLQGLLKTLKKWRFIRYDEKRDLIFADASLYIQVDRARMEDFVIDLARRMGLESPIQAVEMVAAGSAMSPAFDEDSP